MKRIFILLAALFFFLNCSFAIDGSVSYATFKANDKNLVEVYLHIVGQTVTFVSKDSVNYVASVEVTIIFSVEDSVKQFKKYVLNTPETTTLINFIDQKRFVLENGSYDLEVTLKDVNTPANIAKYNTKISLDYSGDELQLSDIQLLASFSETKESNIFTKGNFFLEPLSFNFYGNRMDKLAFYAEIYNSDKVIGEDYLMTYKIEKVVNNSFNPTEIIGHRRQHPKPVDNVLMAIDISRLPSGNYNFVIELRDRTKKLLTGKSIFFQRSNKYLSKDVPADSLDLSEEFVAKLDADQLQYSLRAISPLVTNKDAVYLSSLIKLGSIENQRSYLFGYWAKRNPANPEKVYKEYMNVARAVDVRFKSGFGHGFETPRGVVFLKYGKPTEIISVDSEPSAPPYEIWFYNDFPATNQTDVKFIFYNPNLAIGDFKLLHSTARGEVNNPQWEIELYRNAPNEVEGRNYIDATHMKDNYQRNARKYFEGF